VVLVVEAVRVSQPYETSTEGKIVVSHLQNQRSAIQMLHTRIEVVSTYVAAVLKGEAPNDYATLRSIQAMVAGLPANEHKTFREEFDQVCTWCPLGRRDANEIGLHRNMPTCNLLHSCRLLLSPRMSSTMYVRRHPPDIYGLTPLAP
jgi:hypothetical protein